MKMRDLLNDVKFWLIIESDRGDRLPIEAFNGIVNRASRYIAQQHKWPFLLKEVTLSTQSSDVDLVLVPDDLCYVEKVYDVTESERELLPVDSERLLELSTAKLRSVGESGPVYYSRFGQFYRLYPKPNGVRDVRLVYYKFPNSDNFTGPEDERESQNEILNNLYDALRWLVLRDASFFVRELDLVQFFEQRFGEAINDAVYASSVNVQGGVRKFASEPG